MPIRKLLLFVTFVFCSFPDCRKKFEENNSRFSWGVCKLDEFNSRNLRLVWDLIVGPQDLELEAYESKSEDLKELEDKESSSDSSSYNPNSDLGAFRYSFLLPLEKKVFNFSDIVGGVPHEVQDLVNFITQNNENYKLVGAKKSKGILFVGPPGTGKTLLAKALAGEVKAHFITSSGSFNNIYRGSGAQKVKEIFEEAKKRSSMGQKVIVFIDEFDSIGKRGSASGINSAITGDNNDTINEFLHQMDGFDNLSENITIIAATNHPEAIDPALLRPGRFDKIVKIDLPEKEKRMALIEHYFYKVPREHQIEDIDSVFEDLSDRSEGFNCADIEELINVAALEAVHNNRGYILKEDLDFALEKITKSKLISRQSQVKFW